MDLITIHGQKVPVDIVFQDSMEEPESACTNRLISAKVGEKTYHRLGADPRDVGDLVRQVAADLTTRCTPAPKLLTVMVTSFAKGFSIDWPASVSAMTKAEVLGIPIVPATQTMADFERKPA